MENQSSTANFFSVDAIFIVKFGILKGRGHIDLCINKLHASGAARNFSRGAKPSKGGTRILKYKISQPKQVFRINSQMIKLVLSATLVLLKEHSRENQRGL